MAHYRKFPYRLEFPDSSERPRNCQALEGALQEARWKLHRYWGETTEYGRAGDYIYDVQTAVITNRNTGYRWILRRGDYHVEFQTPQMFEETVAQQTIDAHLTMEEAEALALAAKAGAIKDSRTKALAEQALDQIAIVCRRVRERIRLGDAFIDAWTSSIPRRTSPHPEPEPSATTEEVVALPRPRYRPLDDPDNLTLKEAGELLGKARNTLYLWYRNGKLPPAIDVSPYIPDSNKPVIVVPRYRLEAWQAGKRMPNIFQAVFEKWGLHEPPWVCYTRRKGSSREDVDFWIKRRGLRMGFSKNGKRIYGEDLEEGKAYDSLTRCILRLEPTQ